MPPSGSPIESFHGDPRNPEQASDVAERKRLHEYVERAAERAAAGDSQSEEILTDDELRSTYLSLMEYYENAGVRYLGEAADVGPFTTHEQTDEREMLQSHLVGIQAQVQEYIEQVDAVERQVIQARDRYRTENGVDPLPADVGYAIDTIASIQADKDLVQQRQKVLVNLGSALIRESFRGSLPADVLRAVDAALADPALTAAERTTLKLVGPGSVEELVRSMVSALPATQPIDKATLENLLKKIVPFASLPPERRIVTASGNRPANAKDQLSIAAGKRALRGIIADEEQKRNTKLFERFPERARYLYLLAGSTPDRIVDGATRSDYRVDFEALSMMLRVTLEKDHPQFSAAALQSTADIANDHNSTAVAALKAKYGLSDAGIIDITNKLLTGGIQTVTIDDVMKAVTFTDVDQLLHLIEDFYGAAVRADVRKMMDERGVTTFNGAKDILSQNHAFSMLIEETADEFAAVWSRKKLKEHLMQNGYQNPTGVSIEELHRRAGVSTTTAQTIKDHLAEIGSIAGYGGRKWLSYVASLPRDFFDTDDNDTELLRSNNRIDALESLNEGLSDLQDEFATAEDNMQRTFTALEARMEGQVDTTRAATSIIPVPDIASHVAANEVALERFKEIRNRLKVAGIDSIADPQLRHKVYYVAWNESIAKAEELIRNPSTITTYHAALLAKIGGNEAMRKKIIIDRGADVLDPMKTELNVKLIEKALPYLQEQGLLLGDAHFGRWLLHPDKARPALESILVNIDASMDGKQALIDAFCDKKTVTLNLSGNKTRVLTHADATVYIQKIQMHLMAQVKDDRASRDLMTLRERVQGPTEMLRSGAESLGRLLHSGDRIKQLTAITMIGAGLYVAYRQIKDKGKWRGVILGIPIAFGLDYVVKDMMGKGVFERLGLNWMKPEERNSAVETFLRQAGKAEGFEELDSDAGFEAMRALKDVPIGELLEWRKQYYAQGMDRKFGAAGVPDKVRSRVGRVRAKLGNVGQRNRPSDQAREQAYELMFKAVEHLCVDVAARNAIRATVDDGAALIEERYVTFTADYLAGFKDDMMEVSKAQPHGAFTFLDVLLLERPTPSAEAEIFSNERFLEWAMRSTGKSIDWIKSKYKEYGSLALVMLEAQKEQLPGRIADVKEAVVDSASAVYDYFRASGTKAYAELDAASKAAWDGTIQSANALGLYVRQHGPDAMEWTYDVGAATVTWSIDSAQNLYRELQRHQGVGNALDGIDRALNATLGFTLSEFVLYHSSFENDVQHVEALAKPENWIPKFKEKLAAVVPQNEIPSDDTIKEWIKKAGSALESSVAQKPDDQKYAAIEQLDAHQRMAIFELVKRRVYSYLMGKRVDTIEGAPDGAAVIPLDVDWAEFINSWDAANDGSTGSAIEKVYGFRVLPFMGAESTTIFGSLQNWIRDHQRGVVRTGFEYAYLFGVDWWTRADAREYLQAVEEYRAQCMSEAERVLKNDLKRNEKLRIYEQFLETLLTNAIIDATLNGKVAPSSPSDPVASPNDPLYLHIREAKYFLRNLRLYRGSSANFGAIQSLDLTPFNSDSHIPPRLEQVIQNESLMMKLKTTTSEVAGERNPEALSSVERQRIDRIVNRISIAGVPDQSTIESADLAFIADVLPRCDATTALTLRQRVDDSFDNDRRSFEGGALRADDVRDRFFDYMRSAGFAKAREMDTLLLNECFPQELLTPESTTVLRDLMAQRDRERDVNKRVRFQHALDGAVVHTMKAVTQKLGTIGIDQLSTSQDLDEILTNIIELYKATDPGVDKVTDAVSMALEYALYRGDHESADAEGKKQFEKYEAFLRRNNLQVPSPNQTSFEYEEGWFNDKDAARVRMRHSYNLSSGYLDYIDQRLNWIQTALQQ